MKKIITLISLIAIVLTSYSQSTSNIKSINNPKLNNIQKIEHKKVFSEEERNKAYYIEIKLTKNPKMTLVNLSDFDIVLIKDKDLVLKLEKLEKFRNKKYKQYFNFIEELSLLGVEIISHSFNFNKENEIHYYLIKL